MSVSFSKLEKFWLILSLNRFSKPFFCPVHSGTPKTHIFGHLVVSHRSQTLFFDLSNFFVQDISKDLSYSFEYSFFCLFKSVVKAFHWSFFIWLIECFISNIGLIFLQYLYLFAEFLIHDFLCVSLYFWVTLQLFFWILFQAFHQSSLLHSPIFMYYSVPFGSHIAFFGHVSCVSMLNFALLVGLLFLYPL